PILCQGMVRDPGLPAAVGLRKHHAQASRKGGELRKHGRFVVTVEDARSTKHLGDLAVGEVVQRNRVRVVVLDPATRSLAHHEARSRAGSGLGFVVGWIGRKRKKGAGLSTGHRDVVAKVIKFKKKIVRS